MASQARTVFGVGVARQTGLIGLRQHMDFIHTLIKIIGNASVR